MEGGALPDDSPPFFLHIFQCYRDVNRTQNYICGKAAELASPLTVDERAATDELNQLSAISSSLSPSLLYNSPLDDGMLINNRQVKWGEIEISQPVTAEPSWLFLRCAFFSAVHRHAVYMRPPLFVLLRAAYCTITPAILLLRDGRKLLKLGPGFLRFSVPPPALANIAAALSGSKINLFPHSNRKENTLASDPRRGLLP